VLTWEAKKEAIFEMPVGTRCERETRTRKIRARARGAFECRDARRLARARARDVRVCDTDD
jgi:hypothetical protein